MPEDPKTKEGPEIGNRITATDLAMLKAKNDALEQQLKDLTKAHTSALQFIDDINRSKLAPIILENTKYTVEDLKKMGTDMMDDLVNTIKMVKHPVAGVSMTSESGSQTGLTAGEKFRFDQDPKKKLYDKGS